MYATAGELLCDLLVLSAGHPRHRNDRRTLKHMLTKARQYTNAGEYYKALPLWCDLAGLACISAGKENKLTVEAAYQVILTCAEKGEAFDAGIKWVLPRVVAVKGIGHPMRRSLIEHAALALCESPDPRLHTELTRMVTELAQQLPGGLGWGSTVVAPVPDEEAYHRHVMLQNRPTALLAEPDASAAVAKLAQAMYERCVAYFDTLGAHWLANVRKVFCLCALANDVLNTEGAAAALPYAIKAKRTGQRELGPNHCATLEATWLYGMTMCGPGRQDAAWSLFTKTLVARARVLGPYHYKVLANKVRLAVWCCV